MNKTVRVRFELDKIEHIPLVPFNTSRALEEVILSFNRMNEVRKRLDSMGAPWSARLTFSGFYTSEDGKSWATVVDAEWEVRDSG